MPWWGWIVVGAALLVSEIAVDAQFYLIFFGVAAVVVGGLLLAGLPAPEWLQWLLFAAFSIVALVAFRKKVYDAVRGNVPGIQPGMGGEEGVALDRIEPGATGRVELRGSVWRAHNTGGRVIEPGATVRAEATSGVVLNVRADA
jgi:hypothetical protein